MRALISSIVVLAACSRAPSHADDRGSMTPSPPTTPGSTAPAAATARVHLDGAGGTATVVVEVVQSPGMVQKGLMYRKYLGTDAGMLFLMGDEDDHHLWMKNTFVPLDILFIGKDLKVAGILYDMKPHDTESKGVGKLSMYVLEVNAGWSKAHGVGPGTAVRFEGVEAAAR